MSDPRDDALVTLALECEHLRQERDYARADAEISHEVIMGLRRAIAGLQRQQTRPRRRVPTTPIRYGTRSLLRRWWWR